jgi:hypothetical protein
VHGVENLPRWGAAVPSRLLGIKLRRYGELFADALVWGGLGVVMKTGTTVSCPYGGLVECVLVWGGRGVVMKTGTTVSCPYGEERERGRCWWHAVAGGSVAGGEG